MTKIRKAIIPAAGYGTGFLPATKAQPKELLPVVDKPIIQFIVEEAVASGIEEILIITGKHKRAIEDHFDSNVELEQNLEEKGKQDLLKIVQSTTRSNLFFVRQSYPKGLGDAVYQAKAFVNDEPFVVMLGDNILYSDQPVTKQLMDLYEALPAPNLAVLPTEATRGSQYGFIEIDKKLGEPKDTYSVKHFVEKPGPDNLPSELAIAGRYILPPEIFGIIEELEPTVDGEIQLTDAIEKLNQTQRVFAHQVEAKRYDVGNKMGYMEMSIDYGLNHPETHQELSNYLINLSRELAADQ
ncbi:UTP--glucose-1-phosphate uridylyltransferase GalU [Hutsoniella sourekii]|uniref:UTP--glucose-1-phosphate uridylyltransferase GalU n=1 Tax=Hutsoniella sourekii TaxID=87650 RepID=UPI00047FD7A1|nr:UTP--glucose-1-phosphate uridylyltransferase GalU [Hutsoniella sourekii]